MVIIFYTVITGTVDGARAHLVNAEVDCSKGMPYFSMVGMLSSEVREAKERVRSAIKNSGYNLLPGRIVVNLSPGDIKKMGVHFDLPIAIAILKAYELISDTNDKDCLFIGELGLNGRIRSVSGILPIVIEAKRHGIRDCVIPVGNYNEASHVEGMNIIPVDSLKEAVEYECSGKIHDRKIKVNNLLYDKCEYDLNEIHGQDLAKRAIEISVAGNHNILLNGQPGSGKSMLAKRITGIMPELSQKELLDITSIYSIAGLLKDGCMVGGRPFRAPHHTITISGMTGGGTYPKPGEVALAHKGVLFLDELPEFTPQVVDSLRQPLEDKKIVITRSMGTYEYECDFLFVAAMNPCKCGYFPDREKCRCTEEEVKKYQSRVSGAIRDRIDICVDVQRIAYEELTDGRKEESSETVKSRIEESYERQKYRYKDIGISYNAKLLPKDIIKYCKLSKDGELLIKKAYETLGITSRGYFKILKVARTIADLDGNENILAEHIEEAIAYRLLSGKE